MIKSIRNAAICLTAAALFCFANTNIRFFDRIATLTEYYFEQDAYVFLNHKNDEFRSIYLISANTAFEAIIVSLDTTVHICISYDNYLGMGRQSAAILFDPREARYALTPFFEYRRYKSELFYQIGLDHRCFHQIDENTRQISPYWNKIYVKASSANFRFKEMKKYYIDAGRDDFLDRLKWRACVGYFIREMGGVDKTLLSGGHPWSAAAEIDIGYSFYKTKSWIFGARNNLALFVDTAKTPYYAGNLGIDADVYNRKYSVGFFMNYNYEFPQTLPLFGKDKLFEWGVRFRF